MTEAGQPLIQIQDLTKVFYTDEISELQESYITFCSCVPAGLHQIGAEHACPTGLSQAEETREVA
jgi:hypothetical protein